MSRNVSEDREELLRALVREVRQFNGLGASFFRVAAGRIDMNVTDLQVIDILDTMGPATAGRLAELTGLTTGAITGMLDRLEKDGFVRRERDPEDGRRVIVRLSPTEEAGKKIAPIFEAVGQDWSRLAARYDDAQLAALLEFLRSGNTMSREEITRLRDVPVDVEGGRTVSTPLGDVASGRLVFPHGTAQLTLRADASMTDLYQADFEGERPEVKVDDGTVTIRYSRRQWLLGMGNRTAVVTLNATIPWRISLQGGASTINAELENLELLELEIKGGMSMFFITLPKPSDSVPIRISGGASEVSIRRPKGVAARVHLKGWVSTLIFDEQTYSNAGNDIRLSSPGYEDATQRYDIQVAGSASTVTLATT